MRRSRSHEDLNAIVANECPTDRPAAARQLRAGEMPNPPRRIEPLAVESKARTPLDKPRRRSEPRTRPTTTPRRNRRRAGTHCPHAAPAARPSRQPAPQQPVGATPQARGHRGPQLWPHRRDLRAVEPPGPEPRGAAGRAGPAAGEPRALRREAFADGEQTFGKRCRRGRRNEWHRGRHGGRRGPEGGRAPQARAVRPGGDAAALPPPPGWQRRHPFQGRLRARCVGRTYSRAHPPCDALVLSAACWRERAVCGRSLHWPRAQWVLYATPTPQQRRTRLRSAGTTPSFAPLGDSAHTSQSASLIVPAPCVAHRPSTVPALTALVAPPLAAGLGGLSPCRIDLVRANGD